MDERVAEPSSSVSPPLLAVTAGGGDPRLQRGAYVTDGINLYEVSAICRRGSSGRLTTTRVEIENCRTFTRIELLPEKIRRSFELVRPAPVADCPDLFEDIAWS